MEQAEHTAIAHYQPKSAGYYYLGSLLATLALLLFLSLFLLPSLMDKPSGLMVMGCIYAALLLIVPPVVVRRFVKHNKQAQLDYFNNAILRIATFFIMMTYANAKLMNGQLNVFYYALDTKLNDLDDIFMVWSFYGKSSLTQVMLGLLELVPAILLLFRRTTFLGAIIMLPVNANVLMVNSLYRVSPFTFIESCLLMAFNLYLIYNYKSEILATIRKINAQPLQFVYKSRLQKIIRNGKIVVLCLIGLMLIRTVYRSASGQLKKLRPVTGGYELVNLMQDDVPVEPGSKQVEHYRKIYFERSWVSGFAADGNNSICNVHVDFWGKDSLAITKNIGSWDNYIPDNSSTFKGTYHQMKDGSLLLKGSQYNHNIEAHYKKLALRNYDYWW